MIYRDLRDMLHADDLSFANFETPVDDTLPMSNYPRFNVHKTYLDAAISGGFDVFSFANNHTNDHGIRGIEGTLRVIQQLPQGVFANGIRKSSDAPLMPIIIEKNGWTIIFLAVTEILNSHDASLSRVQYSPPTITGRQTLRKRIEQIAASRPDALFILSLHTNEPEYVRTVSERKKKWFVELAQSGVDIVWAHHPHVMQPWELVHVQDRSCLFMYSMGNFISGQRWRINHDNPAADREYTGDAVLMQVSLESGCETGQLVSPHITALPVTNYLDIREGMVVKRFTQVFIDSLPDALSRYYRERYEHLESYLPLLPTMTQPSILE